MFGNKRQAWQAWQISQAYNRPPSEVYGVKGAVGLFFDRGIFFFGRHVEGVVQSAGADAINPSFARMAEARAFAAAMGDDMETSTAGFADPFADGVIENTPDGIDGEDEILMSGY